MNRELIAQLDSAIRFGTPTTPAFLEKIKAALSPESTPQMSTLNAMSPEGLHPATKKLVFDFACALADKLHEAEKKYGYSDGWRDNDWMDECRVKLREHVEKGDPRDVAAYCAFLWHHGESTAPKIRGAVYESWKRLAEQRGWKVPLNDAFPDQTWIDYWAAMAKYETQLAAGDPDPGRPVVPHRSGGGAS
jgi:hypothetical protein